VSPINGHDRRLARPSPSHSGSPALTALGEAIRAARIERGLPQEALAYETGLDRSYVGGIERGEHDLTLVNPLRIDPHATRIINALDRMGGVGKARDVSRAARPNAAEMKAAIGFLLTKAPAVIAIEERSVIGGRGAMQKVAWLRRL
jgi:transcriptional regulator with XRE-family HTH domain